jgi:hypothetical protein
MLKHAYQLGIKLAFDEAGLSPEQMIAAQRLGGIGGGLAGASGGSLLGKYLGNQAAESFDLDPDRAKLIGMLLGGAAGAGLGGYAGSQVPKYMMRQQGGSTAGLTPPDQSVADQPYSNSALGLLPSAYNSGGSYSPEEYYLPEY